jgi:hypothetical protein
MGVREESSFLKCAQGGTDQPNETEKTTQNTTRPTENKEKT